MTCGIYKITENETGKAYIGKSKNIEKRWKVHHNRFSPDLFSYEVIMECDEEQLAFWEIAWIASERSVEFGFNVTVGGNGGWGSKNPEQTRAKKSASQKGKKRGPQSEEHIAKRSASQKGKKKSGESNAKRSASMKGKKLGKHKQIQCPHCSLIGGNIMKRHHFDNCKSKPKDVL
tara:strand:+ start:417 stop:941 length:525 start_codon:yes stop_codon:yes gene_type:complete